MPKYDLIGHKINRLTIQQVFRGDAVNKGYQCVALCDCGTVKQIRVCEVLANRIKSCGCIRTEKHGRPSANRTHNKSGSRIYKMWHSMNGRCHSQESQAYKYYGDRGIEVCQQWRSPNGFAQFLADMGDPGPGKSIDRINNDGNYEPGNVRWVTQKEQTRNTRRNRLITFEDQTMCIADWSVKTGLSPQCITHRIDVGWPVEQALSLPSGQKWWEMKRAKPNANSGCVGGN